MDIYAHVNMEAKKKAMESLMGLFDKTPGQNPEGSHLQLLAE